MPNMPVSAQRAAIEKVIGAPPLSCLLRDDRGDFDPEEPFGPRQRRHDEPGGAGKDALQPLAHLAIDRLAMADIGDVDDDAADMAELAARFLEQEFYVLHGLARLHRGVADKEALAGLEILRDLAAEEDDRPAGNHRLAEVVVELLLGIGVARVERSDPGMDGRMGGRVGEAHASPSRRSERAIGTAGINERLAGFGGDREDLAGEDAMRSEI